MLLHGIVFAIVYWFAFSLRYEFQIPEQEWLTLCFTLPAVVVIKMMIFYYGGHCHRTWHSVSFSDLVALLNSATMSLLVIMTINGLLAHNIHPSRIVLILDWALTILALGGLRAIGRLSREELGPRLWRSGLSQSLDRRRESIGRNASPPPAL